MRGEYHLTEKIWLYSGRDAWHFITIPSDVTEEINFYFDHLKRGWGSLRVEVTLGETTWRTSIFSDKKSGTFMLPIKAEVRKKESVGAGDEVEFVLRIID